MKNNIVLFIIFCFCSVLVLSSNKTNQKKYKSKILLDKNEQFNTGITISESINLTIISSNSYPFYVTMYTPKGKPFVFKGDKLVYNGVVSYIEIQNIHHEENKIKIYWNKNEKDEFADFLNSLLSFLSICSLMATILFDTKSYIRKSLLIVVLSFELYRSANYENIGSMVRKKMLGI